MRKKLSKFIGTRQFYKLALAVAVPLMMQQLITSSVNLVDNLMVGQLGDAALGGVAAVNRFYIIATYGTNGVLAAAAIFIAQFFGAQDHERMKQSFRFSILSAYAIYDSVLSAGLSCAGGVSSASLLAIRHRSAGGSLYADCVVYVFAHGVVAWYFQRDAGCRGN